MALDTLLTSCKVVGKRKTVGLVRHAKYYLARVERPKPEVCALRVAGAPLHVAGGFREEADLRPDEPVYALANRTRAEFALVEGTLASRAGPAPGSLPAALTLPPGTSGAVLFDAYGNLIAIVPARRKDGPPDRLAATPVTADLAPLLVSRTIEPAVARRPALLPVSGGRPALILVLLDEPDPDDASERHVAVAPEAAARPEARDADGAYDRAADDQGGRGANAGRTSGSTAGSGSAGARSGGGRSGRDRGRSGDDHGRGRDGGRDSGHGGRDGHSGKR